MRDATHMAHTRSVLGSQETGRSGYFPVNNERERERERERDGRREREREG